MTAILPMTNSQTTLQRLNPERVPRLHRSSLHSRFQHERAHLHLHIYAAAAGVLMLALTAIAALL